MTDARFVGDVGERGLIARIVSRLPASPRAVRVGVGDDAALVEPEPRTLDVLTTDALVEDVHFDLRLMTAREVGAKALAVNLSDIAAMGARPRVALLSLGLPDRLLLETYDAVVDGLVDLARESGVAVVGGNITRSPGPLFLDVTLMGSVHARKVLTRSGGRPGDELHVSGAVGGAAAGLQWLLAHAERRETMDEELAKPEHRDIVGGVTAWRRPCARLRLGLTIGRRRAASACMDLSDGLADAVRQVAEASGTGALVIGEDIPVHQAVPAVIPPGADPARFALEAGEDYELLFAVPPRRRRAFHAAVALAGAPPARRVGVLTRERGVRLRTRGGDEPLPSGYEHFASARGSYASPAREARPC